MSFGNGNGNNGSLLAQALEVPSLTHQNSLDSSSITTMDDDNNSLLASASSPRLSSTPRTSHHSILEASSSSDVLLPQHSDYTIPTSNLKAAQEHYYQQQHQQYNQDQRLQPQTNGNNDTTHAPGSHYIPMSPPAAIAPLRKQQQQQQQHNQRPRSILGNNVTSRYYVRSKQEMARTTPPHHQAHPAHSGGSSGNATTAPRRSASLSPPASPRLLNLPIPPNPTIVSPLTPYDRRFHRDDLIDTTTTTTTSRSGTIGNAHDPTTETDGIMTTTSHKKKHHKHRHSSNTLPKPKRLLHETIHAQSLLIGIAFMAIWSPSNLMAPNLTQMATATFHMTSEQRDLYLGSYCALAVGVFSLPISALLGFMVDFYSRKRLFVCCIVGGSAATAWTATSTNFASLFLSRLCTGGFMSASVSIAFSLLGDLFATEERNAASSGLTAMMGMGILVGQVYSGVVGPQLGWTHPFWVSSVLSLICAVAVAVWVNEPDRGAKEVALQALLKNGEKYERKLTLRAFLHAMRTNASNKILLWSGFFTSLPWGIVFVFLNDYLSQEKGFSVPDATFMVMLFGIGTAIGGISGGYFGQTLTRYNRSYLPLYMAVSTFLGILPFLGLLNSTFPNPHGYKAMGYSILGGCIASLPSVNVRPCLLNVNPPETRGAALTAANLLVALGRGIGPSCITLLGSGFGLSRQTAFNITLGGFWTIAAIQLLFLANTLPHDQDAMEAELTRYAESAAASRKNSGNNLEDKNNDDEEGGGGGGGGDINSIATDGDKIDYRKIGGEAELTSLSRDGGGGGSSGMLADDELDSLLSMEEYINSFDGHAARQSFMLVKQGIREIKDEMTCLTCGGGGGNSSSDEDDAESPATLERRKEFWKRQRMNSMNATSSSIDDDDDDGLKSIDAASSSVANEKTPLLIV